MKSEKVRSVNPGRYSFFAVCVLAFFGIFVYKMVDWQILNFEYYKKRANSSNVYFIKTDAVRGEIWIRAERLWLSMIRVTRLL